MDGSAIERDLISGIVSVVTDAMPIPTNAVWSSPQAWRLVGSLNSLRRTIEDSTALLAASAHARLERDYQALETTRNTLLREAARIADDGTPEDCRALTHRIIQYYRDIGELEQKAAR